jgi:hypothetical protein
MWLAAGSGITYDKVPSGGGAPRQARRDVAGGHREEDRGWALCGRHHPRKISGFNSQHEMRPANTLTIRGPMTYPPTKVMAINDNAAGTFLQESHFNFY